MTAADKDYEVPSHKPARGPYIEQPPSTLSFRNFSVLKMEAVHSTETFTNFYQVAGGHIPEDNDLHSQQREPQISQF
jgi:hypothetical protein